MEIGNRKALADEILEDARRKAERNHERAGREARKILDAALADADRLTAGVLDAARRRAERLTKAAGATVGQEVRRDLLAAQENELAKLFDQALERLERRKGYDYPATLAALAAEAIRAMDTGHVVLGFAEGVHPLATGEWLAEVRRRAGRDVAIDVSEEPEPIRGGVVVRSADGRLLVDNSFAARLARLRPDLRRQVAALVYPHAADEARGAK